MQRERVLLGYYKNCKYNFMKENILEKNKEEKDFFDVDSLNHDELFLLTAILKKRLKKEGLFLGVNAINKESFKKFYADINDNGSFFGINEEGKGREIKPLEPILVQGRPYGNEKVDRWFWVNTSGKAFETPVGTKFVAIHKDHSESPIVNVVPIEDFIEEDLLKIKSGEASPVFEYRGSFAGDVLQ